MLTRQTIPTHEGIARLQPLRSCALTIGIQLAIRLVTVPIEGQIIALVVQSLASVVLATIGKLTLPWTLCNLFLPLATHAELSHWVPLAGLTVGLLIFFPTLREPIPFYPTRPGLYRDIAELISETGARRCVDLGSGFGSILFALAPSFPDTLFVGYETGIVPVTIARIRSWWYPNTLFIRKSLWTANLAEFDLIYAFLSPPPMGQLERKLHAEMGSHATFVTNSFPLPGYSPSSSVSCGGQSLLIYRRSDIGGTIGAVR